MLCLYDYLWLYFNLYLQMSARDKFDKCCVCTPTVCNILTYTFKSVLERSLKILCFYAYRLLYLNSYLTMNAREVWNVFFSKWSISSYIVDTICIVGTMVFTYIPMLDIIISLFITVHAIDFCKLYLIEHWQLIAIVDNILSCCVAFPRR